MQLCFGDRSGFMCRPINDAAMRRGGGVLGTRQPPDTTVAGAGNGSSAGAPAMWWGPGSLVRAPGGRIMLRALHLQGFAAGAHSIAVWLQDAAGRHVSAPGA